MSSNISSIGAEPINAYVARQMAKYDRNGDGVIELQGVPIIAPYAEAGNDGPGQFMREAAPLGNGFVLDSYSFGQAVYNRVDLNHDGQISLWEKLVGLIKFGMW